MALSALKPEQTKKFYTDYLDAMLKFRPTIFAATKTSKNLGNDLKNKINSNPELSKAFKAMSFTEEELKRLIDEFADNGNKLQNLKIDLIQQALKKFIGSIQNVINLFPKLTNQIREQKEKRILKQIIQQEIKSSYKASR